MVHHLALYKLRSDVTVERLEEMIRRTRSMLLRVPGVLAVRSGRSIDPDNEWPFYVGLDFDSRARQAIFEDDPLYLKYLTEVIDPNTVRSMVVDYELEPGRDPRYS